MTSLRKNSSRYEPTKYDGIFIDKRSQIYYLRDTVRIDADRSVWIDRSLKTKQPSAALDRAAAIKNKLIRGEEATKPNRHTFTEAFDLLIKIQSTKGARTHEQTVLQIDKHLRPWFMGGNGTEAHCKYLDEFCQRYEELWAEYKIDQAALKPRKLEHDRRYLIMALKRAQKKGWIEKEFTKADFDLNEVSDPIGQYVEPEEVKAMLDASKAYPKFYLQILIALTLGMRLREILHLNRDEINIKKREIDLNPKRIKTRRRREVPIPISDDLYPLIKKALDASDGSYLFPAEYHNEGGRPSDPNQPQDDNSYHWDKVRLTAARSLAKKHRPEISPEELESVGPLTCRFHDLRHTAITNMLKAGLPDIAVRKICGVSETTMRRIYAHIESELKERFRNVFRGIYVE